MLQELLDRPDRQVIVAQHRPRPRPASHVHRLNPQHSATALRSSLTYRAKTLTTSSDTTR